MGQASDITADTSRTTRYRRITFHLNPTIAGAKLSAIAIRHSTLTLIGFCITAGLVVGFASAVINPLYLLAGAAVLAVGLWTIRNTEYALWLVVVTIGILPRFASPVKFGLTPTFLDLALILFVLAWLLRGSSNQPLHFRDVSIALPLIGLISVAVATFVVGIPNGPLTSLILRRFTELVFSLALVFVIIAVVRDRLRLFRVMRVIIIVGALAAFAGVVLYVIPQDLAIRTLSALRPFGYPTGTDVLRFINDDPTLMQRATGFWIDPNAYGGFLLVVGALTLPQVVTPKPLLPRWIVLLCMTTIGIALVLTISRGAILGLLCAGILVGCLRYKRLISMLVIVVVLALILPHTRDLIAHFADGFQAKDLATQMRLGEYKDALTLIGRYPLLGVGFTDTPDVDLYIGVSSMYLLVAQQMGLLGLTAFGFVVFSLYSGAIRKWHLIKQHESLYAVWLGLYGAITGALLSGTVDHYFFNIDFHNSVMLLWLVIALAVCAGLPAVIEAPTSSHTEPV